MSSNGIEISLDAMAQFELLGFEEKTLIGTRQGQQSRLHPIARITFS